MNLSDMFRYPNLYIQCELLLRVFIACLLGGAIGYERKNRNKCAGIRTHAIVALGASLIMIVSKYGFTDIPSYDAARVAAQVVSGIGFLGAGIIFIRNNSVSGLTTAAGIWTTAGVGLAMGSGLYIIGIVVTFFVIIVQVVLHRISFLSSENVTADLRLTLVAEDGAIDRIRKLMADERLELLTLKVNKAKKDEIKLELLVIYPAGYNKIQFISELAKRSDILAVFG